MAATATSKTLLVIGANRGIGYELVTRCQNRGYQVYGTYRPQTRDDPTVINLKKQGVQTFEVDVLDENSITAMARDFGSKPLDVLINCAGIYSDWDTKRFNEQTLSDYMNHFRVNTMGPMLTSTALLPSLSLCTSLHGAKIINISGNMGSMTNNYGGNASYRVSKTALNQLTRTMALDLERSGSEDASGSDENGENENENKKKRNRVLTLAVHPGWLPTRLTDGKGEDDMAVCCEGIIDTFERLGCDEGREDSGDGDGDGHEHGGKKKMPVVENGSFVKWNGEKMPL